MRTAFHEVFVEPKPLIVVVHLPPLPGSPLYKGDFESIVAAAITDSKVAAESGADGIIIENFGDKPFREHASKATVAAMAVIARRVSEEVDVPIGINVLRNDGEAAVAVAHVSGASFVRVNAYVELVASDQGLLRPQAWDVQMTKRILGCNVAVFADIQVKHGYSLTFDRHTDAARAAVTRGLADAVIVTGRETGTPPPPEVVAEVKRAVSAPVLVGSGITPSNLEFYKEADGFIVGTYLHEEGQIGRPLDPMRVKKLALLVRKLRR